MHAELRGEVIGGKREEVQSFHDRSFFFYKKKIQRLRTGV
jgi:hypothetical protein